MGWSPREKGNSKGKSREGGRNRKRLGDLLGRRAIPGPQVGLEARCEQAGAGMVLGPTGKQ